MAKVTKRILKELKLKLEKERALIEKELESFAKKDEKLKGDWDSHFPYFNGEVGSTALEKAADEVEEYETKLPIEYSLETRLKDINLALEKIRALLKAKTLNTSYLEKGRYGVCEKCKKPISLQRLKVCPEARFCMKCQKR